MTKHRILGTAGHIDHGKSTLIHTLTGIDPDRWVEEKKRGITIDLGFAEYRDTEGNTWGCVDVPGHEKFVHNMLAGVSGIDAVLLVVAADEGVMPQTREHFYICSLLGITKGIIVLSKCDRVDEVELIELCKEEIQELVAGSFLESAPMVSVSSITGQGIEDLQKELHQLLRKEFPSNKRSFFRMFVDRSFSLHGVGTVVTGTVSQGEFKLEEEVWLYPDEEQIRIRGIEVHGKSASYIVAGQRGALHIANRKSYEIQRGHQIATAQTLCKTWMLNVKVSLIPGMEIKEKEEVKVHCGTAVVLARCSLFSSDVLLEEGYLQLRLQTPMSVGAGDRIILRSISPLNTIAGGHIVDPLPLKSRIKNEELMYQMLLAEQQDWETYLEIMLRFQGFDGISESAIAMRMALSRKKIRLVLQALVQKSKIISCASTTQNWYFHAQVMQQFEKKLLQTLQQYHRDFPERFGMTLHEIKSKFTDWNIESWMLAQFIARCSKQKKIHRQQDRIAVISHQAKMDVSKQQQLENLLVEIAKGKFQPPRKTQLFALCDLPLQIGNELLKYAVHENQLVRITEDLYFLPEVIAEIEQNIIQFFTRQEQLTVIQCKELLQISRKYAIELLEYFDAQQLTRRNENTRTLV